MPAIFWPKGYQYGLQKYSYCHQPGQSAADCDVNPHRNIIFLRWGRYRNSDATCYSKIIGKLRDRKNFENRARTSQYARKCSHKSVSVTNKSPVDTVAATKRPATRKPLRKEPRIERM